MRKIFKSKNNNKKKLKKILILFLISFFSAYLLSKINLFKNENFIKKLANTSLNKINSINFNLKGEYLLNIGLATFNDIKFTKEVFKEEKKDNNLKTRIYIYNTHQTEEYKTIENYNLIPTVLTAAYILKDKLKDYDIGSIVEESDLKNELNKYGYNYNQAYNVSRKWLENLNDPNLDLYIDLHRDSINYKLSNVIVDNKDYAKIMFVVGTNYNYEKNMIVAKSLMNEIEKINKEISRGIYTRASVYNQDYNGNCVLIEVGGPESSYQSVSNSINVLAIAIKNYLGE